MFLNNSIFKNEQVQKAPVIYRYFPAGVNEVNAAVFSGFAALNAGLTKANRKQKYKKERTDNYSKKKQNAPPQGDSIFRRGMVTN